MDMDNTVLTVEGREWVEVQKSIRGINGNGKKYNKKIILKKPACNLSHFSFPLL